ERDASWRATRRLPVREVHRRHAAGTERFVDRVGAETRRHRTSVHESHSHCGVCACSAIASAWTHRSMTRGCTVTGDETTKSCRFAGEWSTLTAMSQTKRGSSCLLSFLAVSSACGKTATEPNADGGEVVNISARDVSAPLREMAKLARPTRLVRDDDEAEPVHRIPHPMMRSTSALRADRVVQDFVGQVPIAATTVNFEGMGAGMAGFTPGGVPPDTDG